MITMINPTLLVLYVSCGWAELRLRLFAVPGSFLSICVLHFAHVAENDRCCFVRCARYVSVAARLALVPSLLSVQTVWNSSPRYLRNSAVRYDRIPRDRKAFLSLAFRRQHIRGFCWCNRTVEIRTFTRILNCRLVVLLPRCTLITVMLCWRRCRPPLALFSVILTLSRLPHGDSAMNHDAWPDGIMCVAMVNYRPLPQAMLSTSTPQQQQQQFQHTVSPPGPALLIS